MMVAIAACCRGVGDGRRRLLCPEPGQLVLDRLPGRDERPADLLVQAVEVGVEQHRVEFQLQVAAGADAGELRQAELLRHPDVEPQGHGASLLRGYDCPVHVAAPRWAAYSATSWSLSALSDARVVLTSRSRRR